VSYVCFDIAVLGSGFAGSLMAMIARRLGYTVVVLDRARHPRFAIGESSTPLANLLLERIATQYDLPQLLPFTKWGSWQRVHPTVPCGLKRGFTFFYHPAHRETDPISDPTHQLLVAASPHDRIADTHWFRADFDAFLIHIAQELGVVLLDEIVLDQFHDETSGTTIEGVRDGRRTKVRARFVVDATGPRGFLHRTLRLRESVPTFMPKTAALFTHFTGVSRLDELHPHLSDHRETPLPFPIDDAAVHHLFDGGWIWVLRFNNGITSAGVAATEAFADDLRFEDGAPAWRRLLDRLPSVREQFEDARPVRDFIHTPSLGFRSSRAVGSRWALLPSAAGFVDPLLSTGIPLTLLGIERLACALKCDLDSSAFIERLDDYAQETFAELDVAEELVAALYATMNDFSLFCALTLLYFAAASYGETALRLDQGRKANSFLLRRDRPDFASAMQRICLRARSNLTPGGRAALIDTIYRTIEPIDVGGFSDRSRRTWFPVKRDDLLAASQKLGVSRERISILLAGTGWDPRPDVE